MNGIENEYNENAEDLLTSVQKEIKRLNLPIQETEIDRAHRLGVLFTDKKGKKQQSVLVKFNSWKARNVMFKARRYSSFYMKADMTKRRFGVLKYAQNS